MVKCDSGMENKCKGKQEERTGGKEKHPARRVPSCHPAIPLQTRLTSLNWERESMNKFMTFCLSFSLSGDTKNWRLPSYSLHSERNFHLQLAQGWCLKIVEVDLHQIEREWTKKRKELLLCMISFSYDIPTPLRSLQAPHFTKISMFGTNHLLYSICPWRVSLTFPLSSSWGSIT